MQTVRWMQRRLDPYPISLIVTKTGKGKNKEVVTSQAGVKKHGARQGGEETGKGQNKKERRNCENSKINAKQYFTRRKVQTGHTGKNGEADEDNEKQLVEKRAVSDAI